MKRYLLAVPLLVWGAHARADAAAAVAASNYQAGLVGKDTYISGNRVNKTYNVNASAVFPLTTLLGTSFTANYDHVNIVSDPYNNAVPSSSWPTCSVHSVTLDAGLFARKPSRGKIGIDYGAGQQTSRCNATFLATGTEKLKTHYATASAEYYFSKVTFGVSRTNTQIESGSGFDSDTLTASWYPVNDMRVSLAADGLDLKKTYHLNMEYQPGFLDNTISLVFGFTTQKQTLTTNVYSVGFMYFFGTKVDLITRDRMYR